jgi:hypothetical protein
MNLVGSEIYDLISNYSNDAIATLALLETTAAMFKNTPYVGTVASMVQQIIKIADVCASDNDGLLNLT